MKYPTEEVDTDYEADSEDAEQDLVSALPAVARSMSLGCLCPNADHNVHTCGFPLREAQSFSNAVEQLCNKQNAKYVSSRLSSKREVGKCPCGCLASSPSDLQFRTRELPSMALFVAGPEILNFQGMKYYPHDIASIWKKDCRTWLWKNGKPFIMRRRDTIFVRHQPYTTKYHQ